MAILLLGAFAFFDGSCGTVFQSVSPEKAAELLPSRHVSLIMEACRPKYTDETWRVSVYGLDFGSHSPVCNPSGSHELVVVVDRDGRIERQRLLRVK